MTDRITELQRIRNRVAMKRSRLRKAGLLPPLPICPRCGAKCTNDRWLPLCSLCAKGHIGSGVGHQPRPVRLAAEQIILELRREAADS